MSTTKFPAEVFIHFEGEGDDEYLLANESADDIAETGHKIRAARYRLVEEVFVTSQTVVKVHKAKK